MFPQRNAMMDNLKGILIFLVVFSHFLLFYVQEGVASTATTTLTYYVYFFHMPLFVFVSGFFSKDASKARAGAFTTLLVPYLLFNTAMMLALYATGAIEFTLLTPVYVHWFLLALFFWRICLPDLVRIRFLLPLSFIAALGVGFFPEFTNVLALGRTIVFFPFFLLGYYSSEEMLARVRSVPKIVAVLLLLLAAWPVYTLTEQDYLSTRIFIAAPYFSIEAISLRVTFLFLAAALGMAVLVLCPEKQLGGLTRAGKNSIVVFLFHRYVTFVFYNLVPADSWRSLHLLTVLILSVLTVWLLGSEIAARFYRAFIKLILAAVQPQRKFRGLSSKEARVVILVSACAIVVLSVAYRKNPASLQDRYTDTPLHAVLDEALQRELESSITISFVGDLILLEDQVKQGWDKVAMTYNFSPVFQYVTPYFDQADFVVGVLEVPLAGESVGYSTSNYDDGIPLYLNGPDQWGEAIKAAGIDLVTTANNHALDKGVEGLERTLEVLERIGLKNIGTHRSGKDEARVLLEEIRGVKLAFVAYTNSLNYYTAQQSHATAADMIGLLASPEDHSRFAWSREMVRRDVRRAQELGADVIIALPHMGTQFEHVADKFSRTWAELMLAEGIDIVLAAHAHAVQPMEYHQTGGEGSRERHSLIVFCPGNFVNNYVEHNGDACAIVHVHISANPARKGAVVGASISPMWIQGPITCQWRPVPIYEAVTDSAVRSQLSMLEWNRIEEVHSLVTEVMLGTALTIDQIQQRYYYLPGRGYARTRFRCEVSEKGFFVGIEAEREKLFKLLAESRRTCVLGDSISAGSKNGGYGWFEPLISIFPDNEFVHHGVGGLTTGEAISRLKEVVDNEADLYIIALGTNDVRYRDKRICAMTPGEFVENMEKISARIIAANPDSELVFINAWLAYDNDIHSHLPPLERDRLLEDFNKALAEFCLRRSFLFIDANTYIRSYLERHPRGDYILDHIHPNARAGVVLYSNAFLFGAEGNWRIRPSMTRPNRGQ